MHVTSIQKNVLIGSVLSLGQLVSSHQAGIGREKKDKCYSVIDKHTDCYVHLVNIANGVLTEGKCR